MTLILRLLSSGRVWFGTALLVLLVVLLGEASRPGFRGGGFVQAVLAMMVALQVAAVALDVRKALAPKRETPRGGLLGLSAGEGVEQGIEGRGLSLITVHLLILFIVVYVAGMYVGLPLFLFAYWYFTDKRSAFHALTLAGVFGILIPYVFSVAVRVPLWTGIAPVVIPGFIGGSVSPPL